MTAPDPNAASPLHFTGQHHDDETGLDHFPARNHTSSWGRWMTPDPLGGHEADPQSLDKYVYALDNPTSLTDPTGLDSYLKCTHTDKNGLTCHQETVGYEKSGDAQKAWVQGKTSDGNFTATLIGNDANGNLVDKTTGTGKYTASVDGSGVQFSKDRGKTSSMGVFDNGTPKTTFQDAGWANRGALAAFTFTLTNSKVEANQLEAGRFTFAGTAAAAGAALKAAGFFQAPVNAEPGTAYRSPGALLTGAGSAHFILGPSQGVPASGVMHFGEHDPFMPPLGLLLHCMEDGAC